MLLPWEPGKFKPIQRVKWKPKYAHLFQAEEVLYWSEISLCPHFFFFFWVKLTDKGVSTGLASRILFSSTLSDTRLPVEWCFCQIYQYFPEKLRLKMHNWRHGCSCTFLILLLSFPPDIWDRPKVMFESQGNTSCCPSVKLAEESEVYLKKNGSSTQSYGRALLQFSTLALCKTNHDDGFITLRKNRHNL